MDTKPAKITPSRQKWPRPPFWMIATLLVAIVASWIPFVVAARARVSKSDQPRIHIIQDMDNQPRYNTQSTSTLFADGRAMRPPVVGTVARGELELDDHYFRGFTRTLNADGTYAVTFFETFPQQITLDLDTLKRGQHQFNVYCAPCHGYDGQGQGMVHRRATAIGTANTGWIPPSNLVEAGIRARPVGHLYNSVNNGIRSMQGYGQQIEVADRWAVVAYVRALQLSAGAPVDVLSPGDLPAAPRVSGEREPATGEQAAGDESEDNQETPTPTSDARLTPAGLTPAGPTPASGEAVTDAAR